MNRNIRLLVKTWVINLISFCYATMILFIDAIVLYRISFLQCVGGVIINK